MNFPRGEGGLDINEVMKVLPHRYPFLMVDRILSFEGETKITGIKSVTINEPFFQGHFPGHPVMPGVLQVEAMAQVASILMMRISKSASRVGYFMSADGVKFRKPVFPGDTLFIHAELTKVARQPPRQGDVPLRGERRGRLRRRADVHLYRQVRNIEIRMSKFETSVRKPNIRILKATRAWLAVSDLLIRTSENCFGFRYPDFGFLEPWSKL